MEDESFDEEFEKITQLLGKDKEHRSVKFLSELADHYAEKAVTSGQWPDAFKAHGLYNACGKRDPDNVRWREKAYEVECKYQSASRRNSSKIGLQEHEGINSYLLRSLQEVRSHVKYMLPVLGSMNKIYTYSSENVIDVDYAILRKLSLEIKSMSGICSNCMVSFVADIMASAVKISGAPPCAYAVIAIGSLARGETTPYSDLEYIFLIENHEYVKAFERLAVISYFLINNFQESGLKIYNIKELMQCDPKFNDNTKSGFEIDGLTDRAGNIPTGHGPGTKTNNKFITTVDGLVTLYEETLASPAKDDNSIADLSAMLASTIFICGNKKLYQELQSKIYKANPNENRKTASLKMLQSDVGKYNFLPDELLSTIKHVKADIFRFPSIVIYDLKIIHQIKASVVWEVIEELRSASKISSSVATSLEFIMCAAQYVRLATYSFYEAQNDKISVLAAVESTEGLAHFPRDLFQLMCLHLIPLKKMIGLPDLSVDDFMKEVPRDQHIAAAYTSYYMNEFWDCIRHFDAQYNSVNRIVTPEHLFMYVQALKNAGKLQTALNCVQDDTLMQLIPPEQSIPLRAEVLRSMGMYPESLEIYKTLESSGNVKILLGIANVYSDMGDTRKALDCYKTALTICDSFQSLISENLAYNNFFNQLLLARKQMVSLQLEMLSYAKSELKSQPGMASSYNDIARTYCDLGDYNHAISYYNKSLEVMKHVYGNSNHPDIASIYGNLANAYSQLCDWTLAIDFYTKSLEIMKNVYGNMNHPDIAKAINNIGIAYSHLGDYKQAMHYYYQSLEIRKYVYGNANHPEIAKSYLSIGNTHSVLGECAQAITCFNKSLEIMSHLYGNTSHPSIAMAYNNIGNAYSRLGDKSQAIGYYNRSLEIGNHVYGTTYHPDIARTYNNISSTYSALGDYSKAISYSNKALEILLHFYGHSNHIDIASSYCNLGCIYSELGDKNQAICFYTKSVEITKQVYGSTNHADIACLYSNIGSLYCDLGEFDQAVSYHSKALEIGNHVYGNSNHPDFARFYSNLGNAYSKSGDNQQAISFYNTTLDILKHVHKTTNHPDVAGAYKNIGSAYSKLGDNNQALTYFNKSLEIMKHLFGGTNHPGIANSYNDIGNAYSKLGDKRQALFFFHKSLEIRKNLHENANHSDLGSSYHNVGCIYSALGDSIQAIIYHKKSLEIMENVYGNTNRSAIAIAYLNMGMAYSNLGDSKMAISFCNKALEIWMHKYGTKQHPNVASCYRSLGNEFYRLGENEQAIINYKESIEIIKHVHGNTNHPDLESSLNSLGNAHFRLGFQLLDQGKFFYSLENLQKAFRSYKLEDTAHQLVLQNILIILYNLWCGTRI